MELGESSHGGNLGFPPLPLSSAALSPPLLNSNPHPAHSQPNQIVFPPFAGLKSPNEGSSRHGSGQDRRPGSKPLQAPLLSPGPLRPGGARPSTTGPLPLQPPRAQISLPPHSAAHDSSLQLQTCPLPSGYPGITGPLPPTPLTSNFIPFFGHLRPPTSTLPPHSAAAVLPQFSIDTTATHNAHQVLADITQTTRGHLSPTQHSQQAWPALVANPHLSIPHQTFTPIPSQNLPSQLHQSLSTLPPSTTFTTVHSTPLVSIPQHHTSFNNIPISPTILQGDTPLLAGPPQHQDNPTSKLSYADSLRPKSVHCLGNIAPYLPDIPLAYQPSGMLDGVPTVSFSVEEMGLAEALFINSYVLKFSGRNPPLHRIRDFVSTWGLSLPYSVGIIDPRHVLIRMTCVDDLKRAQSIETHKVDSCLFRGFRWTPSFNPRRESSITAVWVQFPTLPFTLFAPTFIHRIAMTLGTPLRLDIPTKDCTRLRFARACIEIDLAKPLPDHLIITTHLDQVIKQQIEYESNISFCSRCSLHGHSVDICRRIPKASTHREPILRQPSHQQPPSSQEKATNTLEPDHPTAQNLTPSTQTSKLVLPTAPSTHNHPLQHGNIHPQLHHSPPLPEVQDITQIVAVVSIKAPQVPLPSATGAAPSSKATTSSHTPTTYSRLQHNAALAKLQAVAPPLLPQFVVVPKLALDATMDGSEVGNSDADEEAHHYAHCRNIKQHTKTYLKKKSKNKHPKRLKQPRPPSKDKVEGDPVGDIVVGEGVGEEEAALAEPPPSIFELPRTSSRKVFPSSEEEAGDSGHEVVVEAEGALSSEDEGVLSAEVFEEEDPSATADAGNIGVGDAATEDGAKEDSDQSSARDPPFVPPASITPLHQFNYDTSSASISASTFQIVQRRKRRPSKTPLRYQE